MPKKIITGQSKLLTKATPLPENPTPSAPKSRLPSNQQNATKLKNYRLSVADQENLQSIVDAVNRISSKEVSQTLIVKALISLGCKTKPERILKEAKEVLKANVDLLM